MKNDILTNFRLTMAEKKIGIYGIVVRHKGEIVASHRWRSDDRVNLFSASKSFTSMAIGMAISEGLLTLDTKVAELFPDKLPENPDKRLFEISIRHLLMMSSGHSEGFLFSADPETYSVDDYVKLFFSKPMKYAPGERFVYNNGATYMLSAALQEKSGVRLKDYLLERLFYPLGIRAPQWYECPDRRTFGSTGLFLKTEELSRFCEMLRCGGVYDGKRLVYEEYIQQASSAQIKNSGFNTDPECAQGYGYQFWRCTYPNTYRADGMYGQLGVIIPDHELTVTINAHEEQRVYDMIRAIWDDILPAI